MGGCVAPGTMNEWIEGAAGGRWQAGRQAGRLVGRLVGQSVWFGLDKLDLFCLTD